MNFRGGGAKRSRVMATLEITPLIDVIFLLLIFFVMTTTPAVSAVEQLDVDLPEAASGEAADVDDALRVVMRVDPDGTIFIDDDSAQEERRVTDLGAELATVYRQNPEAAIWIRGDVEASHGAVIELLDVARHVGFQRVHMAVRPAH